MIRFNGSENDPVRRGTMAACVHEYPELFPGNTKANIQKAMSWWKSRQKLLEENQKSITRLVDGGVKRVQLNASAGRGCKRAEWVIWLHGKVLPEFLQLRAMGVKILPDLLLEVALSELYKSTDKWNQNSTWKGKKIVDQLDSRWVRTFCERNNVVVRHASGKLAVSKDKQASIERAIAYHLGTVKRQFENVELDEDLVYNMDETHFIINMDDNKTLDIRGAKKIKYHVVVSGGEGMTMVVLLRGGANACIETPMMIFKNDNSSYPIRGVREVPGAAYRSGPCGWMDRRVFCEWLREDRCVKADPLGRTKDIFMDNAAGHKALDAIDDAEEKAYMDAVITQKGVKIRFLPANGTNLCQPADVAVIQKLKQVWRREWCKEKLRLVQRNKFSNIPNQKGEWSGKLQQPGKTFYLELAARCCRIVSAMRDDDGISVVRKGMIRCGLSKNLNGKWEECQLTPELQALVAQHRENFDGKEPTDFCEALV